jgi:hypothetical protein
MAEKYSMICILSHHVFFIIHWFLCTSTISVVWLLWKEQQ